MEFLLSIINKIINWVKLNILLFLIIFLGLILRMVIVYPGYYSHGDEIMYGQAVYMITHKTLSMQTQWFGYPPLIGWVMTATFTFVFIPFAWGFTLLRHFNEISMFIVPVILGVIITILWLHRVKHLDNKRTTLIFILLFWGILIVSGIIAVSQTNLFHGEIFGKNSVNALFWGRYLTAIFGAAVVYLIYKVVLNFFQSKTSGLLAALFVAVNYRLVISSHIGFIDMYNVFFLLTVLWAISSLLREPSWKNYLLVWVLVSMSFLTKYQLYAFFPFFLAHLIISCRYYNQGFKKFLAKFFNRGVVFGGMLALAIVLIAHIHYFEYWERVLEIHEYEAGKYSFGVNMINLHPVSYIYNVGVGVWLSWLSIFGILVGLLKRDFRLPTLLLLSIFPIVVYLYMYYTGGGFFTRNVIVLIPILLMFAALFINFIFNFCIKNNILHVRVAGIIFLITALFFGLKEHVINDKIMVEGYSQKPTYTKAREWTQKNIKGDVILATYPNNPTAKDKRVKVKSLPFLDKVFSYRELRQEGYDYAILDMTDIQGIFVWWMKQSPEIALKFWNKPSDLLSQGYIALALREILWSHSPQSFLTPWQASGLNYVVVKLDKDVNQAFLPTIKYDFEDNKWTPLYYLSEDKNELFTDKVGRNNKEALVIKSRGLLPGSVRWQSPYFEIKPNYGYKAVGWIKNSSKLTKEIRDGFLRLDFYFQEIPASITSRPIVSFVTERIYGESEWHQIEVYGIAPKDAKYATIGFQVDNPLVSYYLDSVEIFQTSTIPQESEFVPIILSDDDLFLPNNRGIL